MPTKIRPATSRQIEFIKKLQKKNGLKEGLSKDMSSLDASRLIGDLVSAESQTKKINEPRLGMAIKECFRLWRKDGKDIYEKYRKEFIEDALDAYKLFSEITEMVALDNIGK